ncbi:MAG: SDR family oxidoreductase [Bifidobacterium psychraerophilum]|uniref:SDR family oxidoreductase n=1 Tax=Bifidobacterium psychraerophilum TaxID=218140 RepID=UPI0039ED966B
MLDMTEGLAGTRVLVIGGTSGFGQRVALESAERGASVTVIGRNRSRVEAMKVFMDERHGGEVVVLDATHENDLEAFLKQRDAYDHVISMIGGAMGGGFMDNSIEDVRLAAEAKFIGSLTVAKTVASHIAHAGSLTLTSGSGGHPYDASGAIIGNQSVDLLVKGLAVELAPDIRVNAIAPAWTPTGLWRHMATQEIERTEEQMSAAIPLGRVATVGEVASAYLFAMQCGFLTGQTIHVDGGVSAL